MPTISSRTFRTIVDELGLAVYVFQQGTRVYANAAAGTLAGTLCANHPGELELAVRDQLAAAAAGSSGRAGPDARAGRLLTMGDGDSFLLHVIPISASRGETAVIVSALGVDLDAFRAKYRLSRREVQVVALVVQGSRNCDIAATLGLSEATVKKHLSHIFDKVGVDTRAQLMASLA